MFTEFFFFKCYCDFNLLLYLFQTKNRSYTTMEVSRVQKISHKVMKKTQPFIFYSMNVIYKVVSSPNNFYITAPLWYNQEFITHKSQKYTSIASNLNIKKW